MARKAFQSTLPARGATLAVSAGTLVWIISIHAPRTGSDFSSSRIVLISSNFNPRSPHGERPATPNAIVSMVTFQSTLPARGATQSSTFITHLSAFQSTLPARGATNQRRAARGREYISIHAPRTGSDWTKAVVDAFVDISIHAPRTGSDYNRSTADAVVDYFNPRSPHGERLSLIL